jgi:uncharacterized protein YecE (DUF72 family)
MLAAYCRRFDTVELNNSFYRLPSAAAFGNWRRSTPEEFLFAVKASRYLTHMKKLKDPESALERFLSAAEALEEKLGPILFQLPPEWNRNTERLENFLRALPTGHRCAFEFRNPGWHVEAVYDLLRRHNAAFCIFDIGGFHSPLVTTADFAYVRLHGPGQQRYQGSYSGKALDAWARQILEWKENLAGVYVYFDNDQAGYAPANAFRLRKRVLALEGKTPKHRRAA